MVTVGAPPGRAVGNRPTNRKAATSGRPDAVASFERGNRAVMG